MSHAARYRNTLLIVADDLGKNLSCYGEPVIRTPNIDQLAASGVRFDMAFASTASCSGSRSVIYTGLHTHENGQYGLQHSFHHFMTHDNVETMPYLFNQAGFLTGIINKVHVGPDHVYPWTVRDESPTRDVRWVADRARDFFSRVKQEGKAFNLTVGYMDPHRDNTRGGFANDKEYRDVTDTAYDPVELQVPFYLNDLPEVRQELAEYYRSISRMDQGVGMLLSELEAAGLDEETLVVFLSDNGPPFLNSKTTLYDAGVRLPLIVRLPGGQAGTSSAMVSYIDVLPTLLDFSGVVPAEFQSVNKAGAPSRRGRSIIPILRGTSDDPTEVYGSHTFHELTNYYPTRFIRTRKWKYHRNICWKLDFPFSADIYASKSWAAIRDSVPGATAKDLMIGGRTLQAYIQRGPEELYNMEEDAMEVVNLAEESEYSSVVREMRNKVETWQRETEDPWLFRDGVSVRSLAQYIGEDGWDVQDRFDFELSSPGSGKS